jgi:hypothetical protein
VLELLWQPWHWWWARVLLLLLLLLLLGLVPLLLCHEVLHLLQHTLWALFHVLGGQEVCNMYSSCDVPGHAC